MSSRKDRESDRRARVAQMQAEQRRAERRRSVLIIGGAAVFAVALVAAVAVPGVLEQRRQDQVEAAAAQPIDGVQDFPDLTRNHVTTPVEYPQSPPVGGNHAPVWTNCGAYDTAVEPTQAVHSLEHGAVWIGYRPGLPDDQVQDLTQLAQANSYVLLSPVNEADAPVVASAWGKQLRLDGAADPRLRAFIRFYAGNGPELGAPCDGASDETLPLPAATPAAPFAATPTA